MFFIIGRTLFKLPWLQSSACIHWVLLLYVICNDVLPKQINKVTETVLPAAGCTVSQYLLLLLYLFFKLQTCMHDVVLLVSLTETTAASEITGKVSRQTKTSEYNETASDDQKKPKNIYSHTVICTVKFIIIDIVSGMWEDVNVRRMRESSCVHL